MGPAVAGVTVSVVSVCWYLRPTRHSMPADWGWGGGIQPPVSGWGKIDHIQTREVGNMHAATRYRLLALILDTRVDFRLPRLRTVLYEY